MEEGNIEEVLVDKELMHIIFCFLPTLGDLRSAAAVCRRWWGLAQDKQVWTFVIRGNVFSRGFLHHTGLGYAPTSPKVQWRLIEGLSAENIVQLATTGDTYDQQHTLAVTEDGRVYAFGDATDNKLGFPATGAVYQPKLIETLKGAQIKKVAVAGAHSVALTQDGRVLTWGFKGNGRLGDGDNSAGSRWEPRVLSNLPTIVDVWCGKGITLLLDEFGRLHSFGVDTQNVTNSSDTLMGFPEGLEFISAACGYCHGVAITTQGQVYSWGNESSGKLGRKGSSDPALIEALVEKKAVQVACGSNHSVVLTEDNLVYTFGSGEHGQLGHPVTDESTPRVVESLLGLGPIQAISAAARHTAVLMQDGRVVCFGEGPDQASGASQQDKMWEARVVKEENWLVPRAFVSGDRAIFLLC